MAREIARKGDQDNVGRVIADQVNENVRVNGKPVAVKGSLMDDGKAITDNVSDTIKIDGQFLAFKDSIVENSDRQIIEGSDDTKGI